MKLHSIVVLYGYSVLTVLFKIHSVRIYRNVQTQSEHILFTGTICMVRKLPISSNVKAGVQKIISAAEQLHQNI